MPVNRRCGNGEAAEDVRANAVARMLFRPLVGERRAAHPEDGFADLVCGKEADVIERDVAIQFRCDLLPLAFVREPWRNHE